MSQQQQTVLRVQSRKPDPLFTPIQAELVITGSTGMTISGSGTTLSPYTGSSSIATDVRFQSKNGGGIVNYALSGTSSVFIYTWAGGLQQNQVLKDQGFNQQIVGNFTVYQNDIVRVVMAPTGNTIIELYLEPDLEESYLYDFLDLYDDIPISLNKSYSELQDLSKKNSDFSIGLKLPGTKKNNKFFENFYNVDNQTLYFDATKRAYCQILISDEKYFQGYLKLNSVSVQNSKVEYDVTLYSTVADLFGKIGNNLMNDLNYADGEYNFNHVFNLATVTSNWDYSPFQYDFVPNYFYPVIHNGYNYDGENVRLSGGTVIDQTRLYTTTKVGSWPTLSGGGGAYSNGVKRYRINSPEDGILNNQLKPALNVAQLIRLMFKTYGYNIKSDFFNTPWFKLLYMYGYFSSEATKFSTKIGQVENYPASGVNIWGQFSTYPGGSAVLGGKMNVYVVKAGTGIPVFCTQPITFTVRYVSLIGQTVGPVQQTIQPLTTGTTLNLPFNPCIVELRSSSVPRSNVPLAYLPAPPGTEVPVSDGIYIDFAYVMNDQIKQIDFLSSIAKKFDLVFVPDPDVPNQIIIEPFDYYIGTGDIHDWTDKISFDKGFTVQPALNFVEAEIIMTDKEDSDEGNKIFKERNNRIYGENKVLNPTDFRSTTKKIETVFSPQFIRQWDTADTAPNGDVKLPLGINYAGTTTETNSGGTQKTVYQYTGVKRQNPKLFYYLGNYSPFTDQYDEIFPYSGTVLTNRFYVLNYSGGSQDTNTTAPFISHTMPVGNADENKITNDSISILFNSESSFDLGAVNTFDAFTENDAYKLFYENRISNLYDKNTRFLSGYFDLKTSDYKNLKPNDLIKINEQYFMWNKIEGFNMINPQLTKVELIQYNNTYQDYPTRYFKYYYCDNQSVVFKFETDMTNPSLSGTSYGWSILYDYYVGVLGGDVSGYTSTIADIQSGNLKNVPYYIYEVSETDYNSGGIPREYDSLWQNTVTGFTGDLNYFNYRTYIRGVSGSTPIEVFNVFTGCTDFNSKVSSYGFVTGSSTYHGVAVTPTPTPTMTPTPTPVVTGGTIGSLILSFGDTEPEDDGVQISITKNGTLVTTIYDNVNDLYICPLQSGDTITISFTGSSLFDSSLDIFRNDYTNDGIETTVITGFTTATGITTYTFTASTVDCSYNFEYIIDVFVNECLLYSSGFNAYTYGMVIDSNDDLYVGGNFTSYSGVTARKMIKLKPNGEIDSTFNYPTTGTTNGAIYSIAINSLNKIFAVGTTTIYNGTTVNRILSLNPDGSINTGFTSGTGFNNVTLDVKVQSNDKVLVGGSFNLYNGTAVNRFAVLNSNGTIDSSAGSVNDTLWNIEFQSDGKILLGGRFTSYSGITANQIVRLNSDYTIDTGFTSGTGLTPAFSFAGVVKELSTGKIIVGGRFQQYRGVTANGIIMLNNDGSIYSGFTSGTGFGPTNLQIFDIVEQLDGKLVMIGEFTSYNNVLCNGLIRLNPDGSIDTTFGDGLENQGLLVTTNGTKLVRNSIGDIYIGGAFDAIDNTLVPDCIGFLNYDGDISICEYCSSLTLSYNGLSTGFTDYVGTYERITSYTGGTISSGYVNPTLGPNYLKFVGGAYTGGENYAIFGKTDGTNYYTLCFLPSPGQCRYLLIKTTGDYYTNTQTSAAGSPIIGQRILNSGIYYPKPGIQYGGSVCDTPSTTTDWFISYSSADCPQSTPTPTPTPTQTITPTSTPTPTITPTQSITPTITPTSDGSTPTPTPTITPTSTVTPTITQTSTPTPTVTPTSGSTCNVQVKVDNNATSGGIGVSDVLVSGVSVTYDSGDNFTVDPGELGFFLTSIQGTVDVEVYYTAHTGEKNINLVDCDNNSFCCDSLDTAGGVCTFNGVIINCPCGGGVQIIVNDGACL